MKEKIEYLIAFHTESKNEAWSVLNEISNIDITKMSKLDKEALKTSKIQLEKEYDMRGCFIAELESLL